MKLVLECKDSDGLTGFNYSHDGYWKTGYHFFEETTPLECANACMEECVAIDSRVGGGACFHYKNKEDITDANKVLHDGIRAYIKC